MGEVQPVVADVRLPPGLWLKIIAADNDDDRKRSGQCVAIQVRTDGFLVAVIARPAYLAIQMTGTVGPCHRRVRVAVATGRTEHGTNDPLRVSHQIARGELAARRMSVKVEARRVGTGSLSVAIDQAIDKNIRP